MLYFYEKHKRRQILKLLLLEDEEMLSSVIAKGLRKLGYAVDTAFDGEEALYLYEINSYDLLILDLNVPHIDGLAVLKKIRKIDEITKILILSARSKVNDRIIGLDSGANDYLIKPFDFGELEARIRNLLRRTFVQKSPVLICKNLKLDTSTKKVYWDNISIELTKKEYSILEYLLMNKNKVISAEDIIEHVWDSEFDPFSNVLRYHIHTLKKKLAQYSELDLIKTVRGQGYIIEENNDETTK